MFSTFSNPIATAIDQGFRNGVPFLSSLPKDALWKLYLESFPEGANPIYKTRQHYDCQCCRNFINDIGGTLFIDEQGNISSPWDIYETLPYPFNIVAEALSKAAHDAAVEKPFYHYKDMVGNEITTQSIRDDEGNLVETINWEHFYASVPENYILDVSTIEEVWAYQNTVMANMNQIQRHFSQFSVDGLNRVLELVTTPAEDLSLNKRLNRRSQYKQVVEDVVKLYNEYHTVNNVQKAVLTLANSNCTALLSFKNSSIGGLVVDLSSGMDEDEAIALYQSKTAAENYQQSTAAPSHTQVNSAVKDLEGCPCLNESKPVTLSIEELEALKR